MASPISKKKETSAITHCQKFEGHTDDVRGVIHLPGGQRIITCSWDGSLRVWNLKSGKQIGDDWRDGDSEVWSITLSPDGKKVVSGCSDGAVRLWDIDTCKLIKKWTGHTMIVISVCWSRDGQRVLSGSHDGIARQWDVGSGETIPEPIEIILASIKTGHYQVWAVVYSPDTTLFATAGRDGPWTTNSIESPVKIWDAKTGKLVATSKDTLTWCARQLGPRTGKRLSLGHMITRLGLGIQPSGSKPQYWMNTLPLSIPLQYHRMAASSQAFRKTRQRDYGTSKMDNPSVRSSSTQGQCTACRFPGMESD
jgi:WD40 repeat protein